MAVSAVQRHDERHRGLAIPRLGDVEGKSAARVALTRDVADADARVIVASRRVSKLRHELVIAAPSWLEKPSTHRLEHGRQRVQRFLHSRETAESSVQADRIAR